VDPIHVGTVINAHNVDDSIDLVNPIDHAVGTAARGVISVQFPGQGLADLVRVVDQRAGKKLRDRRRDRRRGRRTSEPSRRPTESSS
jgi:hypothetical protein